MTTKLIPNAADYGMVAVCKQAFFATIGKLDVHPRAEGRYDQRFGYLSKWKTPLGNVLGGTVGGTVFAETTYMVTPEFFAANRTAIERATEEAQGAAHDEVLEHRAGEAAPRG